VLYAVCVLSYLGAMGFVVLAEIAEKAAGARTGLSPTTKLIVLVTAGLAIAGTAFVWAFEPSIRTLPASLQFHNAFFQVMTASTTVGFNTLPIGALAPSTIVVIYLLMFVGASPSGTGGGLKTTTAALLAATATASLRGRDTVNAAGYKIPALRVQQAAGTLVIGLLVVFAGVVLLDLTGNYAFDKMLFEVISALSTAGLSMGLTSELNDAGKLVIMAIMYIGRVGILSFFVAFALMGRTEDDEAVTQQDVIL
jgi:trk system potassium uptake protein